ncbi:isocitrate lyase/phosphoenolpyruvate mutase family protein [Mesorhizobium sp. Cs1299R1N1]|uniref:isocitrate lyase/phosphoenolpyruvate mutase family protein n=1 Tax=Mesorhizobium sp. Cs1299R1N1 TaxID=3015172 RepID=UPI003FA53847
MKGDVRSVSDPHIGEEASAADSGGNASEGMPTLHDLICIDDEPSFLMEAHDAVSAAITQPAGFKARWASGLSISSSLGDRDANEAFCSEVANVVERMARAGARNTLACA